MSADLLTIATAIRQLSYSDMMRLCDDLYAGLDGDNLADDILRNDGLRPKKIADALFFAAHQILEEKDTSQ